MKIAVIGAGNGGQAIAGYLALIGHDVSICDKDENKVNRLKKIGGIYLKGKLSGFGKLTDITIDATSIVVGADLVMIATTANAHTVIAHQIAPFIKDGQIIVLNPGRTCGALEFRKTLLSSGCSKRFFLAEAQTLVYACRLIEEGIVNIIGVKDEVLLAALPSSDTDYILSVLNPIYSCFSKAENVLRTSLENIGAIFHPCVLLFNAATIERQTDFYFYRDMTPQVASFIEVFDKERLEVGNAYGISLLGVNDWISYAYKDTQGDTLCEKMKNNPAYYDIKSPSTIYTRQLMEDIPTGVLPIMELGKAAGLEMKLFKAMIDICSSLLGIDFYSRGRTLVNLGLGTCKKEDILKYIE